MTSKLVFMASFLILTSAFILMTSEVSSGQACAACKFQRRRCTPDCIFRPYFPANQPSDFQNAHRLFGVGNIQKILESAPPPQREDAAKSIKYESYIRSIIPDRGCCKIIWDLENKIQLTTAQILHTQTLTAQFKSAAAAAYDPAVVSPSSEIITPSLNITLNNNNYYYCFPEGVAADDATNDFVSGGGYCGNFACETETIPFLPDSTTTNDLGLCPAAENANNNNQNGNDNHENAIDFGVSPPPPPNNDNQIQECDDDLLLSFLETKQTGDEWYVLRFLLLIANVLIYSMTFLKLVWDQEAHFLNFLNVLLLIANLLNYQFKDL